MSWSRIETRVRTEHADAAGAAARAELELVGLRAHGVRVHRIYYIEGLTDPQRFADEVLVDPVLEEGAVDSPLPGTGVAVSVWKRPGVMDPVEASVLRAARAVGEAPSRAVTGETYWIEAGNYAEEIAAGVGQSLANDVIEEMGLGDVPAPRELPRGDRDAAIPSIDLEELDDDGLLAVSRRHVLALNADEMRTIRDHFRGLGRSPRLGELETIAQTWSEHCKHKTLTGPIEYTEDGRTERIDNLLKQTVFGATKKLAKNWCVSVFKDNAGIIRFDDEFDACFKVETHNHPSALEPYGGAGTGTGGVIRDILGTGLGARPVANTDVFCFGDLAVRTSELPKGVLHPRRVMKGVVAGVRDYGNRMGIPTVNGAVCFDERYVGNPIVYCGTVGILPRGMSEKEALPGDMIVAAGGRTGRDGIHGATFSSEALHDESDEMSGGAVQIGNAIEEKRVLDALLRARDRGLYRAVTDCGAGGFSSAVGEMGEEVGAEVWLERAPLKYDGLNPVEIWISEAQERMVFAVPPEHVDEMLAVFRAEDVEATVIGRFTGDRRLLVKHGEQVVVDLGMEFLHDGLPDTPRQAAWTTPDLPADPEPPENLRAALVSALHNGNVCSKEWIVRQYDHEVQAGSAIKPLVGKDSRGPGDAAVVAPVLGSRRGLVISNGINPRYGDLDPYRMAMLAVDEAIRNAVAVGADPDRIALLDNFSWGDCGNPETLGALVRACRGCHDAALLFGAPFISGKDSLNNEFRTAEGSIRIPHTLLVSALGQVDDVTRCVTSDLKRAGNRIVLVGLTYAELGGGFLGAGGTCPEVRDSAPSVMRAVAAAIRSGRVRACHDLSEGGLAVAITEMALAAGLGARVERTAIPSGESIEREELLWFSESPSRFLLEIDDELGESALEIDAPHAVVGEVTSEPIVDFGSFHIPLEIAGNAFFHWEESF